MLDDEESDNFADFDDDEEALGVTDGPCSPRS
jgi:hypothetical protein